MCVENPAKLPVYLSLLPKFALELSGDETLLELIFKYQNKPCEKYYNKVQDYLNIKNAEYEAKLSKLSNTKITEYLGIIDSDQNLLWTTGPKELSAKLVLLYQSPDYNNATALQIFVKLFEDGLKLSTAVAGGPGLYQGGRSAFSFMAVVPDT